MNQPELGKKILELRKSKGLTQGELAENCKQSLRTIQRIESVKVTPRSHTIKVILSNLDYDLNNSSINLSSNSGKDYSTKNWLEQFFKYVLDLFNLKTNTMKKLSVLSFVLSLIIVAVFLSSNEIKAQKIEGWFMAGSNPNSYSMGLDKSIYKTGGSSAFIESVDKKIIGFGTLMQTCSANDYLGKRVKMSAYIKSKKVDGWAGMWLRVDAKQKRAVSFDNMGDRPIKNDTDWTKYEIILDVPEESETLNFGVLLNGKGKVWFDSIKFEVVEKLKTTQREKRPLKEKPLNLDFGK